jgi:hypothetical protein
LKETALRMIMKRSSSTLLSASLGLFLIAVSFPTTGIAQDTTAGQCAKFVQKFRAAQIKVGFQSRFTTPTFKPEASRTIRGLPVYVAMVDNKDEMAVACDADGTLASVSIDGHSAEDADFNRMSAVAVSVISALSDTVSKTESGDIYFKLYQSAEARLRSVPNTADKGVDATDKWNNLAIRMTHFPSRAMRFEVAKSADFMKDTALPPAATTSSSDQSGRQWRCDASDPDGRTGMADVSGMGGNVAPPIPEKGTCVVRAQPHHLYRNPRPLLGRVVEMKEMGCYRHDYGDYRCIPYQAHLKSSEANRVVISAPEIAGDGLQDLIDENCPTMRRGLESRSCKFKISFELLKFATDHTETIRSIQTSRIWLIP